MSGLPGGAVTFLFTDIEGSTRLVKVLRERYGQVLAEHRRLIRAAIAGQRGFEVDAQGDAFFAAFAGAKQAVLCALEIHRALAAQDWPPGAPVRVRIGIHTGQAVPVEGEYTGLAVHRAARICAVARGGQVLVSQATRMIIEDEEEQEPGFALVDLGEHTLKDFDRSVRLFELAAPGLAPADSPGAGRAQAVPPVALQGAAGRRGGDGRAVAGPPASFAGLLQQLRAESGLTREELARAAGLGLQTVSDLEQGAHRTAHQDTARMLADALGLAGPAHGLFVAAARGQAEAAQVLAARADAPAALAAMVTSAPWPPAAPVPRELPADVGAFTGRAVELAELDLLLPGASERQARPAGPVVISVVSGAPGVGKTALAVRWAHRAADAFPDGQLYVNLRGYDPDQPVTPGEALAGFLQALGLPSTDIPLGEAGRAARYRSLIAGRRVLVVLDNAASEEQVRPLLPGSGPVMVVVTSRDALAGLVARDGACRLNLDLLPVEDAVALLYSLVGARAETDPGTAERLVELCARLPLALRVAAELAVARPDTPLAELAAELASEADRLELLVAGGDPRSAVASVFSWSYRHLAEDAAHMFRLLGLHPSQDWDQYAAAALTDTSLAQARRLLAVLARGHLIQPAAGGRYQMHDLLRAYAAGQATAHDTDQARQEALTRLFDYYLAASAAAMDRLEPADPFRRPAPPPVRSPVPEFGDRAAALGWLDAELGTLVSVTAHTASHGWPSHTTRLADTLTGYIWSGHATEGLTIDLHAIDAARASGDRAAQSKTLFTLGYLHGQQGRNGQAADSYQQALALAKDVGSLYLQSLALMGTGATQGHQGRLRESAHYYEQASALAREQGDRSWDEAIIETNLSLTYLQLGRYQQAEQLLEGAHRLFRELGDLSGVAYALNNLGGTCGEQGRYQEAAGYLREALATAREVGDRWAEADGLTFLGRVCHRQGRYDQAAECHRQALVLYRETGSRDGEADALNGAGRTLLATGQPDQARACHANALTLTRQTGNRYLQAHALIGLGEVSHCQGQHAQAAEYHGQALDLFQATGSRGGEAEALNGAGEALLATGQPDQARTRHTTALGFARETGNRYQQARAHRGLAAACHAVGQIDQARQHRQHALDIYASIGVPEAIQMRSSPAAVTRTGAGS